MFLSNLHAHTFYSDGKSHAEDYVKKAIEKGFESVGISDHSPVVSDMGHLAWVADLHMQAEEYPNYIAELTALREKYKDQIEVYIGMEEDYYPPTKREGLDYTIGAVHFVQSPLNGKYHIPDYTLEEFKEAAVSFCSFEKFLEGYYKRLRWVVEEHTPDILSHIDLPTKFNEKDHVFDTSESWYRAMVYEVLDAVEKTPVIIEMNSGAISRGYRTTPYPDSFILHEMKKRGIPVTISSDAHTADSIATAYSDMVAIAKDHGFRTAKMLKGGKFIDVSL